MAGRDHYKGPPKKVPLYRGRGPEFTTATVVDLSVPSVGTTVLNHGADPTGQKDSRDAFVAALAANRRVFIPAGEYLIGSSIEVPDNSIIEGEGVSSVLFASSDIEYSESAVFVVGSADNVVIRDLKIEARSAAQVSGIYVHGTSEKVVLQGIQLNDLMRGINVGFAGFEDDNGDRTKHIVIRDCHYRHSNSTSGTSQFGFRIGFTESYVIDSCSAYGAWLDGVKLNWSARNGSIVNCDFSYNGASGAGDGIDSANGGDGVSISNTFTNNNSASGINIKITPDAQSIEHWVKDVSVVGCVARNNGSIGISVATGDLTNATSLPNRVSIIGGVCELNGLDGVRVIGHGVIVQGLTSRLNGEYGIHFHARSWDCMAYACQGVANGTTASGSFSDIYLNGHRQAAIGCITVGKSNLAAGDEGQEAAVDPTSIYGVRLGTTASGCRVESCLAHDHSNINLFRNSGASDNIINQNGSGSPTGRYGGIGSLYQDHDNGDVYLKVSDPTGVSGWNKLTAPPYNVEYGTQAPVAGTYSVGDRVYNTSPSPTGFNGWVCVTSGSPGTWQGFGTIDNS